MYINCEKSEGLYLAEPGLTAGWQFGSRNLGKAKDFQCFLQIEIFDLSLCLAKVQHYFNNSDALQTLLKINTATRSLYGV